MSRQVVGAPDPTERPTEHLLDGQQRLTALWRAFHDNYDNRTYLVSIEADEEHGARRTRSTVASAPRVHSQARWFPGQPRAAPAPRVHHLFPNSLLVEDGRVPESDSFRAPNCALITWRPNRSISAKTPLRYLRDRIDRSDLGEEEIRRRLESHLIPFDAINVGGYADIVDADQRAHRIAADYESFVHARAEMVHEVTLKLCSGQSPSTPG